MRGTIRRAKAPEIAGFAIMLALVLVIVADFLPTLSFVPAAHAADRNRAAGEPSGSDDRGADDAPHGRDFDPPSEDGTDDDERPARPGTAEPEQTPGCRFRNGPLELLV